MTSTTAPAEHPAMRPTFDFLLFLVSTGRAGLGDAATVGGVAVSDCVLEGEICEDGVAVKAIPMLAPAELSPEVVAADDDDEMSGPMSKAFDLRLPPSPCI